MKARVYQTEIARAIGVHKSTISREIRRNRGLRGYRPKQAQRLAEIRREEATQPRISSNTWALVKRLLRKDWSYRRLQAPLLLDVPILCKPESAH